MSCRFIYVISQFMRIQGSHREGSRFGFDRCLRFRQKNRKIFRGRTGCQTFVEALKRLLKLCHIRIAVLAVRCAAGVNELLAQISRLIAIPSCR